MPGVPWSQWDFTASPTALGISNLREFQFTSIPATTSDASAAPLGDKTNWSGEITVDTWSHVAVVNDPASRTTTMYVDGAPVLRNAPDTVGMSHQDGMAWILGADWVDDAPRHGWHCCIGETRSHHRPTPAPHRHHHGADLTGFPVPAATH